MNLIQITREAVVLVDDVDYPSLSQYNWSLNPIGASYAVRKGRSGTGEKRTVQMHRQILGASDRVQVDHINGNGLDNRRSNLRIASVQMNAFNRKKPDVPCTSRYKGVFQRKGKTVWEARLKYNNKHIHLGTFKTETIGAAAYNYAAELIFGDFARPNNGVPELPDELKMIIYARCLKILTRYNWHPNTDAFLLAGSSIKQESCSISK